MDGQSDRLLTPGEVAALFRVDPKTVTRWAASGRISSIRTPGGHRRYREVQDQQHSDSGRSPALSGGRDPGLARHRRRPCAEVRSGQL